MSFLSRQSNYWKRIDYFHLFCWGASIATVLLFALIICEIISKAAPAIQEFGWHFLTGSEWRPNRDIYGVFPMIIGTAASSFIALFLALPLGVSVSLFLSENFLPATPRHFFRMMIEMLAATPSVVYGLWGIFTVVPLVHHYGNMIARHSHSLPFLKGPAYGNSLLTASLVLSLMILPTIASLSRSALEAVPQSLREGAYALGATRWETILHVRIPYAAPGIIAAAILALGRAMGETMAVAMLIGNSQCFTLSLFSPSNTLSALLANQFAEADGLQISALMYVALILVILTLGTNFLGEIIRRHMQKITAEGH
ncbi:MAG: phosphate ABC transporter permease subunit PstC [Chthoniobacterales bacterium]|nr:phosphate ABC transporter permease subunit PstC [Chthoniobacterales bacterium]